MEPEPCKLPALPRSRYRLRVAPFCMYPPALKARSRLLACASSALFMLMVGCQNYGDQLARGQGYYEQNQYEAALSVWRNLEADQNSLTRPEVVRYCYLRGMTDFRLGYQSDARYYLGLARAGLNRAQGLDGGENVALQPAEKKRLDETLAELHAKVYGIESEEDPEALGDKCAWTSDCEAGFACQEGMCIRAEGPEIAPSRRGAPASRPTAPRTEAE